MNQMMLKGFISMLVASAPAAVLAHGDGPHDQGTHEHSHHAHGAAAHSHASPHGGEVVDLEDLHAEVVFGEEALLVYFYDANMKPLPAPPSGKATLAVGKKVMKGDLTNNVDHLAGPLPTPTAQKATAIVQAVVAGKARNVRAERPEGRAPAAIPHHDHRSLRGGQVGMSGDDHVELLVEKGGVYKVWFTDGHRNPIMSGVRGRLVVTATDGRKEVIELSGPGKEGVLTGKGSPLEGVARKVELDGFANGNPFRYPFDLPAGVATK